MIGSQIAPLLAVGDWPVRNSPRASQQVAAAGAPEL